MISKITSANGELYYKPAFDLINAAVAEQKVKRSDSNASYLNIPEIKSIEDYFNNLTAIRELWVNLEQSEDSIISGDIGGYLLLMPADEDIFVINADTREINIPAKVKKNGIGVFGDHFAEMIVLQIDRYFDNQDLLKTKCAINWNFTGNGERAPMFEENQAEEAFVPNADLKPGYVTFGFIINKNMTPKKGTLTFSVTFYDEAAGEIAYSFNTLTASVAINDTLSLQDPALVKSDISNFLGRLTNSVYSDSTLSPIANPVWHMGEFVEDKYLGLPAVEYLPAESDRNGVYTVGNGTILRTFASVDPSTADIFYRWVFNPVDGTVVTARTTTTNTFVSDYIKINPSDMTDQYAYYLMDANDRIAVTPIRFGEVTSENSIEVTNPLSLEDVNAVLAAIEAINADENETNIDIPDFYIRGSSMEALSAGKYQVFAQGHLGTGTYQEVVETAALKAGVNYYLKNDDDEIDIINPVRNNEAIQAREEGKTLYVFVGGSSNSAEVKSNKCEIPAAKKPTVVLGVTSEFSFEDNPNVIQIDPNDTRYTYIDEVIRPGITATVSLDSEDSRDFAGQFAVQLIDSSAPVIEDEEALAEILPGLNFSDFPADGVFEGVASADDLTTGKFLISGMEEGSYAVRAFNRRNGTYSVSDNSDIIITSYVAPAVQALDVKTVVDGEVITVLSNGIRPNNVIADLEMSRTRPTFDFEVIDNSNNYAEAEVAYFIEEVEYDEDTGIVTARNASGKDENNEPYEYGGQEDLRPIEVVADEITEGVTHLVFSIERDPGYYRIKTQNTYHGTICTAYTDIFGISTH